MDIGTWLRDLGLGQYEQAFRENDIDGDVLADLTADDLSGLGVVSIGHRRKLLAAIAALRTASPPASAPLTLVATTPSVAAPPSSEAERRQLTVMFIDLVGSTALAARLDPEDMRDVLRGFQDRVAGEVARFGGHLAKFMGDGALVYFGWPQAHEDDPERAARAGVSVVADIARLRTPSGESLAARVGIATGWVVVGDLTGHDEARERAVVGAAPNLAARLQAAAEPGSVVIDIATRKLVGNLFELSDLGPTWLKGIAEPVRAYVLAGERATPSRFEARSAAVRPIVGRETELGLLLQRWRQTQAGEGQGILLLGEAGIGKSRIVRAFTDALREENPISLRYQASPLHSDQALWPVGQQLAFAAGFERDDDSPARLAKLSILLRQTADVDAETVALIATATGLVESDAAPSDATPGERRTRTLVALLDQLLGWARQRPAVVIVEDAHWLDPTTLELFDQALGRTSGAPVLILVTSRPDPPRLASHAQLTRLTLNRLSREATAKIAANVVGMTVPPEVVQTILAQSDGIPLFIEELTKALIENQALDAHGISQLSETAVPASLQGSLMERLDRLGPAKEVAQVAACIGREFDHTVLAKVTALPEVDLDKAMSRLAAAELVFRRGAPPEAQYSFKHALLRDAAADSLLRSRRKIVHQRIADVLTRQAAGGAAVSAEVLAYHCEEAGALEQAARHWLTAGDRNAHRAANIEALRCFDRALRNLEGLADPEATKRLELDIQLARIPVLMSVGFADRQTAEAAERALALCSALGAADRTLPLLFSQFSYCTSSAQLKQALEIACRIVLHGDSSGDPLSQLVGHRAVGFCWSWMGDLAMAERELGTALRLAATLQRPDLAYPLGHDPNITARTYLGGVKLRQGEINEACTLIAEALEEAKRLDHTLTLALVLRHSSIFEALAGNHKKVQTLASALRDLCVERGVRQWRYLGELLFLWASNRLGAAVEKDQIRGAFERQRETEFRLNIPFNQMLVAEVCFAAGDPEGTIDLLHEALSLAEVTGELWLRPELLRLRAYYSLLGVGSSSECAEQWLSDALYEARQQGDRLAELRVSHDLACVWAEQGKRQKARQFLGAICGQFGGRGDLPAVTEATALLHALS
jgi:class 3 adenylate cyclase/tetratricopeptide (TPR) repeat protein